MRYQINQETGLAQPNRVGRPDRQKTQIRCLDDTSIHKTTTQHFDRHETSTQCFVCCDILLLRHFDPVTFDYCDILSLKRFTTATFRAKVNRFFIHFKIRQKNGLQYLSQRDTSNHCNFGQPMTVASSPILILIFVAFFVFKETAA